MKTLLIIDANLGQGSRLYGENPAWSGGAESTSGNY